MFPRTAAIVVGIGVLGLIRMAWLKSAMALSWSPLSSQALPRLLYAMAVLAESLGPKRRMASVNSMMALSYSPFLSEASPRLA